MRGRRSVGALDLVRCMMRMTGGPAHRHPVGTSPTGLRHTVERRGAGVGCGPGMILAIDQGTTGSTCLVFDHEARLVGRAYREFEQHFPRPGWVEHDAAGDLGDDAARSPARRSRTPGVADGGLSAIGITNQRETSASGTRRPASRCTARSSGRTGAPPTAARSCATPGTSRWCASAPGSSWTRTSRRRRSSGCCARSTAWPSARATGARSSGRSTPGSSGTSRGEHATDPSNASRTMLYDLRTGGWDGELLDLFGVPERALPERPALDGDARRHDRRRAARARRGAGGGHRRRPAGGALRAGVPRPRDGQEHLRHRVVRARERRGRAARRPARAARDGRLGHRRAALLRPGGRDLRHRRRDPVAARRAGDHQRRRRDARRSPPRSTATTASTSCPR